MPNTPGILSLAFAVPSAIYGAAYLLSGGKIHTKGEQEEEEE